MDINFTFDPEVDIDLFIEEDWKECFCESKGAKIPFELDTDEHVREALLYFSQSDNRAKHSKEEQNHTLARILRAAKKYGILVNKETLQEVKEEMDLKIGELKTLAAELKAIAEKFASTASTPEEEELKIIKELKDEKLYKIASALQESLVGIEATFKDLTDKVQAIPAKPSMTEEEIVALKQKAEAGDLASKELADIKASQVVETRLKSLETDGVRFDGDVAQAQTEKVKTMSEEQFVAYKSELLHLKSVTAKQVEAAIAEKAKTQSDDKKTGAALLAVATKETKLDQDKVKLYEQV